MSGTGLTLADLPAHYHAYAQGPGAPILRAFADPTVYARIRTAALAGIPGAFGAIELAEAEMRKAAPAAQWDDRGKKFLGFCAATYWRKRGHRTTGVKRLMPHPSFSRGEVYEVDDYRPLGLVPKAMPIRGADDDRANVA